MKKTVKVGRDVELRKGYMKEGRNMGKIVEVHIVSTVYIPIINIMDDLFQYQITVHYGTNTRIQRTISQVRSI